MKFYPYEKGGAEKVLAILEGGGHNKFWGSFYSFSHIVGGHEKFPLFKRGTRKVLPCLGGGGEARKVSDPRFSHFVAPPPPHN